MQGSLAIAKTIGIDAWHALRPGVGEIAAVFRRSFYISINGRLACMGGAEIGRGPLNVILEEADDFNWQNLLTLGQTVGVHRGSIRIAGLPPIGLAAAAIWEPRSPPAFCIASVRRGLAGLEDLLSVFPPPSEGLGGYGSAKYAPVTPVACAAQAQIRTLANWLASGGECPLDTGRLLGLGPGLTPSGDDFLAGVLAILHAVGANRCLRLLWAVVEHSLPSTSVISATHLRCAAQGRLAASQHDLLDALFAGEIAVIQRGLDGLSMDHTSPWDSLAGMATALRALARSRSEERFPKPYRNQSVAIASRN